MSVVRVAIAGASGRMGRVVAAHPEDHLRPVISILRNEKGQPLPMKQILQVDLVKDKNERIVKVVDAVLASKLRTWVAGRVPIATVYDELTDAIALLVG